MRFYNSQLSGNVEYVHIPMHIHVCIYIYIYIYIHIYIYIEYSFFHLRVIERHRPFSFRGIDLMLTIKKL